MSKIIIGLYGDQLLSRERMNQRTSENTDVMFLINPDICDVAIVINKLDSTKTVRARKGFLWKIVMEPYIAGVNEFAVIHDSKYDLVFCQLNPTQDSRVMISPPYLPWFIDETLEDLKQQNVVPQKSKKISAVISTKSFYPGHEQRLIFASQIEKSELEVDLYGRGRANEVSNKSDALTKYMFSLAIENCSQENYWTEKLIDCFLTYTIPVYYGAPNVFEFFPKDAIIELPISDVELSFQIIEALDSDEYLRRLPALKVARKKVIEEYNFYSVFSERVLESQEKIFQAPHITLRLKANQSYFKKIKRKLVSVFSK